jgi:hypothetical protein
MTIHFTHSGTSTVEFNMDSIVSSAALSTFWSWFDSTPLDYFDSYAKKLADSKFPKVNPPKVY